MDKNPGDDRRGKSLKDPPIKKKLRISKNRHRDVPQDANDSFHAEDHPELSDVDEFDGNPPDFGYSISYHFHHDNRRKYFRAF